MKFTVIAVLFLASFSGTLSAAELTDLGGGFAYQSVAGGQCRILIDTKYGSPIFETSKRAPSKMVLVGSKAECPTEYNGFKVNRLASGQTSGFIYTGVSDAGRHLHIYRKMGANFTFVYGPKPKK